jgi:restriction system protein
VFKVTQANGIQATDLLKFINSLLECVDLFNELTDSNLSKDDLDIRINVQSPGPIEIISIASVAALVIGIVAISLFGGGFKFKFSHINEEKTINTQIETEISTEGLLEKN